MGFNSAFKGLRKIVHQVGSIILENAAHSLRTEYNSVSWTDLQTLSMSREGPKNEIYRHSPPCIPSGTILPVSGQHVADWTKITTRKPTETPSKQNSHLILAIPHKLPHALRRFIKYFFASEYS
jgi:hypothetical protein